MIQMEKPMHWNLKTFRGVLEIEDKNYRKMLSDSWERSKPSNWNIRISLRLKNLSWPMMDNSSL